MKDILDRRDVLAVFPTGSGKSLTYQIFVRAKDFQMNGKAIVCYFSVA